MEGTPLSSEDDADDKDSNGKSKKKAEALGAFVVEPKATADKSESLWDRLVGSTDKKPAAEAAAKHIEADEEAELITELAPDEQQYVAAEIVQAYNTLPEPQYAETVSDEEAYAAEQAVQQFREKIVVQHEDAEQAFSETMAEIEQPSEAASEGEPGVATPEPEQPAEFGEEPIAIPRPEQLPEDADEPVAQEVPATRYIPIPKPVPARSAPVAPETQYIMYEDRSAVVSAAFIGGTVGYLLGRRRGRIKTERRLQPVQEKLQKQVKALEENLAGKEMTIRKAAIESQRQNPVVRTEARLARSPERQKIAAAPRPERIGQVVVTAEATRNTSIEQSASQRERALSIDRHTETLSRIDLLELSSKIVIDGTSLRQIYETHLINEKGLRRLVGEHLKGGDVRKMLRRELVEHQIDFERDPQLRDRAIQQLSAGGTTSILNNLLQQADATLGVGDQDNLAQIVKNTDDLKKEQQKTRSRQSAADAAMITLIVVLLGLVVYLAFGRG